MEMLLLGLEELEVGKKYKAIESASQIEFTYLGLQDELSREHNVVLKDGTKSFLVKGDKIVAY